MSEVQPQISGQTQDQAEPQTQAPVQPPVQPQPKHGFSGKQVVGIIVGVLVLLAFGVAIGGAIGYRMGMTEGAQQALANRAAAQAPALDQQMPQGQQMPRGFDMPFQQLPATNPGGPYLGVTFQMITPEIAAQEGITGTTGALVREVTAEGPAATAGLKAGDVVIAVNGQPVNDQNDLRSRVAAFQPNDEITLTIVTGTANGPIDQHDVKVTLGERPLEQSFNFEMPFEFDENGMPRLPFGENGMPQLPDTAPAMSGAYLGIEYELITPEVAAREAISGTNGALIKTVVADSPAAKAGLKAGDVISAVDGKAIDETNNLRDIVPGHKPGDVITLTIAQGTANGPTDQHDVKVKLGERPAEQSFNFQMPFGDNNGLPTLPFGDNGLPTLPDTAPATSGAYLGIEYELITPEVVARENLTGTTGALIKTVVADSPAAKAGLKAGDVISAVDGKAINETNNLSTVVLGHKSGDVLALTIVKGTANGPIDQRDVQVTLAARPAQRQFQMPQPGAPSPDSREG